MYTRIYYYMYIFNHDGTQDAFEVVNFNSGEHFDAGFLGPGQNPSMAEVKLHLLDIESQGQMIFALRTDAITMRFANAMNSGKLIRKMGLAVEPYETQVSVIYRDSPGFVLNRAVFMFDVKVEKIWMRMKDPNVIGKVYGIIDPYIDVIQVSFKSSTEMDYGDSPVREKWNGMGRDDPIQRWQPDT